MDKLISLYQKSLKLQEATFSRIEHAEAMVAIVYKITQPNGVSLILKICSSPHDYWREVYFLTYFKDKLPVPRLLEAVAPEIDRHGAILMECLSGTVIERADFTDALAYEMGSLLARIHLHRAAGYGDVIQPQTLSPDPRTPFSLKFEEGLAECSSHLPKELLEQCHRYYDKHLNLLSSVDGPCLTHRDFRAGNMIIEKGKIKGIIDWSSGRASFAQEDFCAVEHGEWPLHASYKQSFLTGYASIRPIPDYSDLMLLLRLNKAIASIGFTVKRETWNSSHAAFYQFNLQFLETFLKKIY